MGLAMATTLAHLQIQGILRWCKQEDIEIRVNQDISALPPWSISSEQIQSGPRTFLGLKNFAATRMRSFAS